MDARTGEVEPLAPSPVPPPPSFAILFIESTSASEGCFIDEDPCASRSGERSHEEAFTHPFTRPIEQWSPKDPRDHPGCNGPAHAPIGADTLPREPRSEPESVR